jgi:two-component system OmpR family response regulator
VKIVERKTILLIEPDAKTRDLEALLLRYFGYDVRAAATAREGLHLARAEGPDLVVTDLFAPGEKAAAFLARLGRAARDAPVLLLTAYPVDDCAAECASRVLSKPCNADALQRAVSNLLASATRRGAGRARRRMVRVLPAAADTRDAR